MVNYPLIGALAPSLDSLPRPKRDWRASLFDRLGPASGVAGFELSDDEKERATRQGLLGLAGGLLSTPGGFGNALGQGIQGGLLALNQGADDTVNNRYKQQMMQRTMAGMDRNTQAEELARRAVRQDGTIDQQVYSQLAAMDPERAKSLRDAMSGEQAKWTPVEISDPNNPGNVISVIHNGQGEFRYPDMTPVFGGFGQSPSSQGPSIGVVQQPGFEQLASAVMAQESGGNPNAVSPKGAIGTMQTMPGTLRDPGFGVAPARDNSPAEMERVGKDYLRQMIGRFGPEGGLAAYNWGPGNWERALAAAGGDVQRALASAPRETQNYVPGVQRRLSQVPPGQGMSTRSESRFSRPRSIASVSEESFGQPQEVIDPASGKPKLVQFGNRGTIRAVVGYDAPQNAAAANKEQMQVEKQVTSLSKRLSDENVPFVDTSLNTIEGMLREYIDENGKVTADIPGYGQFDSFKPDMAAGQEARDLRQSVAGLANTILKSRSGAAVTDSELRRFLQEAGTNKGMPEQQLINGIKLVRKWFDAQKRNVRGGYSPEVLSSYYANSPENSGLLGPLDASVPEKKTKSVVLEPGTVQDGYQFRGGDPANPMNWKRL